MLGDRMLRLPLVVRRLERGPAFVPLLMMPASVSALVGAAVLHLPFGKYAAGVSTAAAALGNLRTLFGGRYAWADAKPRDVTLTELGIAIDGMKSIPRSVIAEGWFQPGAEARGIVQRLPAPPSVVIVDRKRRPVFQAIVADEVQARRLLRVLGLDARRGRLELRGASPTSDALWLVILVVLLMATATLEKCGLSALEPWLLLCLPFLIVLSVPASIAVDARGVTYRWLGWRRFLPLEGIALVTPLEQTGIRIAMKDGDVYHVSTGGQPQHGERPVQHRDAVLARTLEVLAHRAGAARASSQHLRAARAHDF